MDSNMVAGCRVVKRGTTAIGWTVIRKRCGMDQRAAERSEVKCKVMVGSTA